MSGISMKKEGNGYQKSLPKDLFIPWHHHIAIFDNLGKHSLRAIINQLSEMNKKVYLGNGSEKWELEENMFRKCNNTQWLISRWFSNFAKKSQGKKTVSKENACI